MDNYTFKKKLLIAGLEKEDFSQLTGVPVSTIIGWTTKRKNKKQYCFPSWVESYLNIYINNKENEVCIKKLLSELKNDK